MRGTRLRTGFPISAHVGTPPFASWLARGFGGSLARIQWLHVAGSSVFNPLHRLHAGHEALMTPEIVPSAKPTTGVNALRREILQDHIAMLLHPLIEDDIGILLISEMYKQYIFFFYKTSFY